MQRGSPAGVARSVDAEGQGRLLPVVMNAQVALALVLLLLTLAVPGWRLVSLAGYLPAVILQWVLIAAYRRQPARLRAIALGTLAVSILLVVAVGATLHADLHDYEAWQGWIWPLSAGMPAVYLLSFALLPTLRALRFSLALWLACALGGVLALVLGLLEDLDPYEFVPVASVVLAGHGLIVLMTALAARHKDGLIQRHAAVAASERRLREAVGESEGRFRSVFDMAAVGINVTDGSGRYLMVNERMAQMLGYTIAELLAKSFREVTWADELPEHDRLNRELAQGRREDFHVEKRYIHKDGHAVPAEIYVREVQGLAGQERRLICVVLDISERKRAEAEAAEQARISEFHFRNTPLAVVEWGPQMRVKRWSERAEQMFGWTAAEAMGRTADELHMVAPEQIEARRLRVERMLHGGEDRVSAIVPMLRRDGRQVWGDVHSSVIRDADGQVRTVVSMALDVTESQEMLRMLNESEARFRGIFNQAAVGIALLDERGRWLNVNQKLCEITGYTLDELVQLDFQTITHPDDRERNQQLARAVKERTLDQYAMEKRYVRKDGSPVWVMLFVRRLDAGSDQPARTVAVVEDISERKAVEARERALMQTLEAKVEERTGQLREMMEVSRRRNDELRLVTEMGRMLAAATDPADVARVAMRFLPQIFPPASGALYLENRQRGLYERQTHWGWGTPGAASFTTTDCWALRGTDIHHVEGEPHSLTCAHVPEDSRQHPHLCVAINVLGQPVGIVELAWGVHADGWAPEIALVRAVADLIGLNLGNLRLREELSRQALMDPLTGLPNRRWLERSMNDRVARHARNGRGFSVLMIDVDHFKSINDRYGHEAGDRALQEVAAALKVAVRDDEFVGRYGGEEFTALVDTTGLDEVLAAAERLRLAVAAIRVQLQGDTPTSLSVSVGAARYPLDGADIPLVVERADAALYAAKRGGRNRVCLCAQEGSPALSG